MAWNTWRRRIVLSFLAVIFTLGLGASPVGAQWGMGYGGWGWGFGGFHYVPSPTNFLNQKALIAASRGQQGPTSNNVYANNPNAYYNRVRDNGFVPRYDVQRRRPSTYRPPPPTSLAERDVPATPAPPPKPVLPLASFFDAANRLVWPSDSPTAGDLKEKRDVSDKAALGVLQETRERGFATIGSVADARQKLLDYGRPALQAIRAYATPRIADAFHLFLLSLYESLEQAAIPAGEASTAASRPS